MEVIVNKELEHMFLGYKLELNQPLIVEHFASTLYTILEPEEYHGIQIDKRDFNEVQK